MPSIKITKSAIDRLPVGARDIVYWDASLPGFGVKVTPKGRKVFLVLYRTGGAGSKLRKYTIGPYGRVTLHQARLAAQRVFAAKFDGRDPAAEKREARRKLIVDRVSDVLEAYITQRLSQNRSGPEIARLLRREIGKAWGGKSVHEIKKRDVVDIVYGIENRGAPAAANKTLKSVKTFFQWCVGRAILDRSPAADVPLPAKVLARDRMLSDDELASVILAARQIGQPYGSIVEFLALTGQRRTEVSELTWAELDLGKSTWTLPATRAKNAKAHVVHLPAQALTLIGAINRTGLLVFANPCTQKPFADFSGTKRLLDVASGVRNWRLHDLRRTCVSGMARLGVPPHVADKVLNHKSGTISGVEAIYQRHEFLKERQEALEIWASHVNEIIGGRQLSTLRAA